MGTRGPEPKPKTIHLLWGKAAGMCQYEGCRELLFYDDTTTCEFNAAYIAHIVASNPDGPRGDPVRSHLLSDKIENLMLLCDKHHRLIDNTDIDGHPESVLLEMKNRREEDVARLLTYFDKQKTYIIHMASPIKGQPVSIDNSQSKLAVLPQKQPAERYALAIELNCVHSSNTIEYWVDLHSNLVVKFNQVRAVMHANPNLHFSVFCLAPMPLIAKFGELFGDKINVDVYQKTREPDTWAWQSDSASNSFCVTRNETQYAQSKDIALIIALCSEIDHSRLDVLKPKVIYTIKAARMGVDCIQSKDDLIAFWHIYQQVCNDIKNNEGADIIHLFPAMPVSAAFEIGRRRMHKVHPKILIYDDNNGFMPTIIIGENNDQR